eukprot:6609205-Pyramimonas_sp.AAC.1
MASKSRDACKRCADMGRTCCNRFRLRVRGVRMHGRVVGAVCWSRRYRNLRPRCVRVVPTWAKKRNDAKEDRRDGTRCHET